MGTFNLDKYLLDLFSFTNLTDFNDRNNDFSLPNPLLIIHYTHVPGNYLLVVLVILFQVIQAIYHVYIISNTGVQYTRYNY